MAGSKSSSMPGDTFRSGVPEPPSRCVQEDSSRTQKAAARFRSTICRTSAGASTSAATTLYRFRGNNLLIFSAELRRTVYKKTDHRGVDVFGFADSGQVWGDARSSTDPAILANHNFSSSNWRSGVGGGHSIQTLSALAARLEVGRSNEGARSTHPCLGASRCPRMRGKFGVRHLCPEKPFACGTQVPDTDDEAQNSSHHRSPTASLEGHDDGARRSCRSEPQRNCSSPGR